jgi:uncharacterized protein YjbI with pentapeptide repeats
MNRQKNRRGRVGVALALAAGFLVGGATYGVVVVAGASGANTTYYACLTTTRTLIKVGTVSPNCKNGSQLISWNSAGPQGPPGVQGPSGTTYDCTTAPYPGIDLAACDLENDSFAGAEMPGANLTDANLTNATLSGAQMYGANLSNAYMTGVTATSVQLDSANLTDASLNNASFSGAEIEFANLDGTNLAGANFAGAYFIDSDFTGQVTFSTTTNFTNADLEDAHFSLDPQDTNPGSAIWSNTTCPDDTNSDDDGGTCVGHLGAPSG